MCGIAGLVGGPDKVMHSTYAKRVTDALRHRGPDDHGYLALHGRTPTKGRDPSLVDGASLFLAHLRLSILDLSETGWQPMSSPDNRAHIVFNGEIYNYLELRRELEPHYQFQSRSDTEVLLAAYLTWGAEALPRLIGMFAFAILDLSKDTLFLARDFFGIKPLYYSTSARGFAFASEIPALLELSNIRPRANAKTVLAYLRHGICDGGAQTFFADVHQLLPGHFMKLKLSNPASLETVRFWEPRVEERKDLGFDEAARELRRIFLRNIDLHLRSDVPVGACLSGGLDSSSIVMGMRQLQGRSLDLHTFSFIPNEALVSEEHWMDIVGKASSSISHKITPVPSDLNRDIAHLIRSQGEPVGGMSIYAQYSVFKRVQQAGIKVMLDGQGADEVLGGYHYYLGARLATLLRKGNLREALRFTSRVRKLPGMKGSRLLAYALAIITPPSLQRGIRTHVTRDLRPSWIRWDWFEARAVAPPLVYHTDEESVLKSLLRKGVTELSLPHLLRFEDRNSMAFSVESRVPFLTPELTQFALSLPEEYLISREATTKSVFRAAMEGILPEPIRTRKDKMGFEAPERTWLNELRPRVEALTQESDLAEMPVLSPSAAARTVREFLASGKNANTVWRILNLVEWTRAFEVSYA